MVVQALEICPIEKKQKMKLKCQSYFRLIWREVVEDIAEETNILKYSFWTEFTVRAFKKGFRVTEVLIIHRNRLNGPTRPYKLSKLPSIVISQMLGLVKLWKILKNS